MASVDELWLTDFGEPYPGEPAARRPALVLGPPGDFGPDFPYVLVTPLTTADRGLSLHVEVEPAPGNGLNQVSYVQCELIRSVSRRRLVHPLGVLDAVTSLRVAQVVRTLLGF